ncbi:thioesterase II family protein [Streptomyces sp. DH10]|uniref:thioesterase II family protein n=1 Tax=Streptomyces sp. DH10 TaxID=3040121 RepID=UPI002442D399|nr:alpha/beta fold hydrolase [Streptomyces sp. DH10]MDG9710516.1 alpha/beta fold hydrolase [Streptomyces sp. DH10]
MKRTAHPRATRAHGWIVGARRPAAPSVRLFCLPYAGGGASTYAAWPALFPDDIEVCPVELPGRLTRWSEKPFARAEPLVETLATALAGELDVPYALFGHSMGALLAFELARTLRRRGACEPQVLFVSGGPAPQLPRRWEQVHDQPDDVVVARLRDLGAVPEDVYAEPELLELLMPTIRADFSVVETHVHRPEPPLGCPVVAFAGTEDREVRPDQVAPWLQQTTGGFTRHLLPGDHFFLNSARDTLLDTVRAALRAAAGQPSTAAEHPIDPMDRPERKEQP